MKANIDYAFSVSKSTNGSISLKVWLSTLVSTDVLELLLYLVRIKDLYTQLVNRQYIVKSLMDKKNISYYDSSLSKPHLNSVRVARSTYYKKWYSKNSRRK
jgi:hypothetical protein